MPAAPAGKDVGAAGMDCGEDVEGERVVTLSPLLYRFNLLLVYKEL